MTRWRRIVITSTGSVMTARMRMRDEQRGHTNGPISYTFAMSLAHAERHAGSGTVQARDSARESSPSVLCDSFPP